MLFTDCHPLTGHCLSCMHDTAGPRCESCAPGYYGDAINAKNCTREFGVLRSGDQVWQCRLQVDSACVCFLLQSVTARRVEPSHVTRAADGAAASPESPGRSAIAAR